MLIVTRFVYKRILAVDLRGPMCSNVFYLYWYLLWKIQ